MVSFNKFFVSSVTNKPETNFKTAGSTWDVVLFVGDYNPITKYEHERIKNFIDDQIKDKSKEQFTSDVEVGLLCDYHFESENEILLEKFKYNLTLQDKEYLTARLLGLRLFPFNLQELMWFAANCEETQETEKRTENIMKAFGEIFEGFNILIVLRPQDEAILGKLERIVEQAGVRIGFVVWKYEPSVGNDLIGAAINNGDLIKATVLMDQFRPFPEDLKAFAYKYKLGKYLEEIRNIHLKVGGTKYLIALMSFFPNISMNEEAEEKLKNYSFIMELLKKMYLGTEYSNTVELNKQRSENKPVMPTGLSSGGGGGSGAAANVGASDNSSFGGDSTGDDTGVETDTAEPETGGETAPSEPESTPET